MKISGYAAVFNSPSGDLGGFVERIQPGAFKQSLKENDIRLLLGHDGTRVPLARTKSGTLRLAEDGHGLKFEASLPDSPAGRDVFEAVKRGDMSAMSFGFRARSDWWSYRDGTPLRTLTDIDLFEVSAVAWPAYPTTAAGVVVEPTVREMWERQRRVTPEQLAAAYPVQWRRLQEAKAK